MIDWTALIADGMRLPAGLTAADALAELVELLRSPDPQIRDELAATAISLLLDDLDEDARVRLGDTMAARLTAPEIYERSFPPLILAGLVRRGTWRAGWLEAFEAWYPAEQDLRGHDPELGWLHAFAHGADLLGAFGRHPAVAPERMLRLAAARLLAPTGYVLRDQEDDRLAYALALTLTREELGAEESVAWLGLIAEEFERGEPGPVPPFATNTMRTLRMLYLCADRGVRVRGREEVVPVRHRDAVKEELARVLGMTFPMVG
ncbi:DUF2785 domain-containing protein [Actinospica durhamensis]|uniref:DUF2785 domain-containing protein n=1 Tax=Actinospica durhamensis TaxID=1508375 RepID=A0A941EUL6_9ACTN|nr:DUF2785 domain-containing protein [Actinospica durhamensis]MBR7837586.1 DUF2785 domain-containing protein [Actinospica durhamensis]